MPITPRKIGFFGLKTSVVKTNLPKIGGEVSKTFSQTAYPAWNCGEITISRVTKVIVCVLRQILVFLGFLKPESRRSHAAPASRRILRDFKNAVDQRGEICSEVWRPGRLLGEANNHPGKLHQFTIVLSAKTRYLLFNILPSLFENIFKFLIPN